MIWVPMYHGRQAIPLPRMGKADLRTKCTNSGYAALAVANHEDGIMSVEQLRLHIAGGGSLGSLQFIAADVASTKSGEISII